jgi:hypothetical protein
MPRAVKGYTKREERRKRANREEREKQRHKEDIVTDRRVDTKTVIIPASF